MGYVLLQTYGFFHANPYPPSRWTGNPMAFEGLCPAKSPANEMDSDQTILNGTESGGILSNGCIID